MTEELKNRYLEIRKRFISRTFDFLNDMQREAVTATEGPILILAGAGSGKTTVLINRIANLIKFGADTGEVPGFIGTEDVEFLEQCYETFPDMFKLGQEDNDSFIRAMNLLKVSEIKPWRIMAITFTNKAADELKARLRNTLGDNGDDVWAMTFHSACVRILRRYIDKLGYDPSFTIYDTADSQSLMKRILSDLNLDDKTYPPRTVLNYISTAKDSMTTPEKFYAEAESGGDIRRKNIGRAYLEYERRLKDANAVDFDGLLLLTVKLLLDDEEVRSTYQKRFQYILIDEYQDTNNLQYLFASTIAKGWGNICVVGDDDQSIYKFRGATIENILNFENQHRNARTIRLEQNYRSCGHILDAANAVIKNNQGRKGKTLWTDRDRGELVELHTAYGEREEAQFIVSKILEGRAAGSNWRDFAVLYRMNALSNQLEFAFKGSGVPYRVVGGMRFFDRAEIKDILAYLCVINNPADDLRLLRVINVPTRGIGLKSISSATEIARRDGRSVYNVLIDSRRYPELERASAKLHVFGDLITELRDSLSKMELDEFYDLLIEKTGYVRRLESGKDDNTSKIENIWELKSNIVRFMQESEDRSLKAFLDEIALYTDLDQMGAENDSVTLMTLHSAKGLEFPTVFIVGMEDGIFPGIRSIGETEEMEEERRLCYVGITRAKEKLFLTCTRRRMLFGRTTSNMRSRFIDEIPAEYLELTGVNIKSGGENDFGDYNTPGRLSSSFDSGHFSGPAHARLGSTQTGKSSAGRKGPKMPVASGLDTEKFKKGDQVEHKAFGHGTISNLQNMGNDALIEIIFDGVGTKRLMLRSAAKHMKKV